MMEIHWAQHYKIHPADIVIVDQKKQKSSGCHNKGSLAMSTGKSYSVKKMRVYRYSGDYLHESFNRKEALGQAQMNEEGKN